MPTNVVMPQMGESIAEGTSSAGSRRSATRSTATSRCSRSRPTRSTRRFPSPAAGVLTEIKVKEGETVPVNSVVAVIGAAGEAAARRRRPTPLSTAAAGSRRRPSRSRRRRPRPAGRSRRPQPMRRPATKPTRTTGKEDLRRQKSSPLVRHIAKEHGIDISADQGHRHLRPRDQAGHPRLHRVRRRGRRRRRRPPRATAAGAGRRSSLARTSASCR